MYIRCKRTFEAKNLTFNDIYTVLSVTRDEKSVKVMNDEGKEHWYSRKRFEDCVNGFDD